MEELRLESPSLLNGSHNTSLFNSGNTDLDAWLKQRALSNQSSGASRTYVVVDQMRRVVGYYALASGSIGAVEAPGWLRRNMPNPIPIALLGRLAIDQAYQSKGLGTALLKDAVIRAQAASQILGIRGILVHALSQPAKVFYQRYGFMETRAGSMTLVLALPTPPFDPEHG